jgi:hypothetical protein
MTGHEKGILPGIGTDVNEYASIRIPCDHDITQQIQDRLFICTKIKNMAINVIGRITFVTHAEEISGKIEMLISVTGENIGCLFPTPIGPIKMIAIKKKLVGNENRRRHHSRQG